MNDIDKSIIKIENLNIGYNKKNPLLNNNISFNIDSGKVWGIVGPNGSGKTTLVKTILGILKPIEGKVFKDKSIRISYVPQKNNNDSVFPVSVLEVVLMGIIYTKSGFGTVSKQDIINAKDLLTQLGLKVNEISNKLFSSLSGGQKQRVMIARALITNPDILVLDEPTSGMDILGEAELFLLVEKLSKEKNISVIVVTHGLHLASNHTDNIILFYGENKVEIGKTKDLINSDKLEMIYKQKFIVKNIDGYSIIYLPLKEEKID